jgi:hypothetical protein
MRKLNAEAVADRGTDAVFQRSGALSSAEVPGVSQITTTYELVCTASREFYSSPSGADTTDRVCMVCMDDIADEHDALSMDCGHLACKGCWVRHVEVQMQEGNACQIRCMAYQCQAVCSQKYASDTQYHIATYWTSSCLHTTSKGACDKIATYV